MASGLLVAGSGCLGLSAVMPRAAVALVLASVLLAAGAVGAAWRAHRTGSRPRTPGPSSATTTVTPHR
ncbi:hypothetical protein EBM89_12415 [Cellulomonas triticagri]|uniref:Uncharacterized protein n=1 Tax=Cellulomonas triticagri TaxID=2483352 RepID=A0A3M2J685_9CELL|nr:hypothetical protein EBM89_12415 [Cellulomonas triticagri]